MKTFNCPFCKKDIVFDENILFEDLEENIGVLNCKCGKEIVIQKIINIEYKTIGHNFNYENCTNDEFLCSECSCKLENKDYYFCPNCKNKVCKLCKEKIKNKYSECYYDMFLCVPMPYVKEMEMFRRKK